LDQNENIFDSQHRTKKEHKNYQRSNSITVT